MLFGKIDFSHSKTSKPVIPYGQGRWRMQAAVRELDSA